MEIVYFTAAIVGLVMTIYFFVIAADIAAIKKILRKRSGYTSLHDDYSRLVFFGETEQAKEVLKKMFWEELSKIKNSTEVPDNQKAGEYKNLLKKYDKLNEYGINIPKDYVVSK